MNVTCAPPDPTLGVAIRVSQYLECEGRALGENGFLALAGGPIGTGVLTGTITIFIAFIGYRMILGHNPGIRDGVGWAARLGIVLALVTAWPAFQTLVYRVAVDGPAEVAAALLPASGLPSASLDVRVQQAYDTIRLGVIDVAAAPTSGTGSATPLAGQVVPTNPFRFQTPLPNTGSMLVISTVGVTGALQLAIGFLLAVAPLAIIALLFDSTIGLFNGWTRALAGSALAVVGVTCVTAVDLALVESELGKLQDFRVAGVAAAIDPQALTTIVMLFAVVVLVVLGAAMRMANALKLRLQPAFVERMIASSASRQDEQVRSLAMTSAANHSSIRSEQSRATVVATILSRSAQREASLIAATGKPGSHLVETGSGDGESRPEIGRAVQRVGATMRRNPLAASRTSIRRDKGA